MRTSVVSLGTIAYTHTIFFCVNLCIYMLFCINRPKSFNFCVYQPMELASGVPKKIFSTNFMTAFVLIGGTITYTRTIFSSCPFFIYKLFLRNHTNSSIFHYISPWIQLPEHPKFVLSQGNTMCTHTSFSHRRLHLRAICKESHQYPIFLCLFSPGIQRPEHPKFVF